MTMLVPATFLTHRPYPTLSPNETPGPDTFFTCPIDDVVDYRDITIPTDEWGRQEVPSCDDLDRNGIVDIKDFRIFADNWLWIKE